MYFKYKKWVFIFSNILHILSALIEYRKPLTLTAHLDNAYIRDVY